MLYDGENISADKIFAEGTSTKSGVITINDLAANTKYYVAVAARNGNNTTMKTLMMQTKESGDNGGGNNGNDDDNGGNGGNDDNFELPEIDGVALKALM